MQVFVRAQICPDPCKRDFPIITIETDMRKTGSVSPVDFTPFFTPILYTPPSTPCLPNMAIMAIFGVKEFDDHFLLPEKLLSDLS